jgi:dipeptidyl aminopeptidase/acylaminoacyl peptidase
VTEPEARDVTGPQTLAYGSWPSPVTAAMVAEAGRSFSDVWIAGGETYWVESRPLEGGRQVLCRSAPYSEPVDVTPEGFSARTKVHEYGGAPYWVDGETMVFAGFEDQRLYRQAGDSVEPVAITPESGGRNRYADGRFIAGGELMVCVRERHEDDGVVNELVALPADGSSEPWILTGGRDFYAYPRPSPDGRRLAWICWDHPQMPWDGTELWVAELGERGETASGARRVAGGPRESVLQPAWSPDHALHFVSDRTGWWNLYRGGDGDEPAEALWPIEAEFGGPLWSLGQSNYAFLSDGRIACVYLREGEGHLALMDPGAGEMLDLDLPYTSFGPEMDAEGMQLAFVAGGPATPQAVVALDFTSRAVDVLRESSELAFDASFVSIPRHIAFPTEGGRTAHALLYAPRHAEVTGPQGELPPLLVVSHGGPTSQADSEFAMGKQFWTTRGFAVVDVDYGGSSGYGREYRERLNGQWGVVDVMDCIAAARHLAEAGEVDGERMAIRGGSAGGYTTLCALTFHADVFAAGASYYGVADAEALAQDTHKFESRYLDNLIGPYPEEAELYRARSPIHFTDLLAAPVILLQGLEDEVVPPAQAEAMVEALRAKGLPYAYITFEGEQHGFRKAENIRRALQAELYFYSKVFGFESADTHEPVAIQNL